MIGLAALTIAASLAIFRQGTPPGAVRTGRELGDRTCPLCWSPAPRAESADPSSRRTWPSAAGTSSPPCAPRVTRDSSIGCPVGRPAGRHRRRPGGQPARLDTRTARRRGEQRGHRRQWTPRGVVGGRGAPSTRRQCRRTAGRVPRRCCRCCGSRVAGIVFISSVNGKVSLPLLGAYSASKFALEAAADAFRWNCVPGASP